MSTTYQSDRPGIDARPVFVGLRSEVIDMLRAARASGRLVSYTQPVRAPGAPGRVMVRLELADPLTAPITEAELKVEPAVRATPVRSVAASGRWMQPWIAVILAVTGAGFLAAVVGLVVMLGRLVAADTTSVVFGALVVVVIGVLAGRRMLTRRRVVEVTTTTRIRS